MAGEQRHEERRRWPRTPVYGEIVGQIDTETAAPVLDLSEHGALLEVPCVLRPRSLYTLGLALGRDAVILLKATVLRSSVHHIEKFGQGESRVRYHAALRFDISERDRVLLRLRIARDESVAWVLGALLKPASDAEGEKASRAAPPEAPPAEPDPLLVGARPHGTPPGAERRDSGRINLEGKVEGDVWLHLESSVLMLSQGGMMVRMPFAPQIGSVVSCSFEIDGQTVRLDAIVRDAHRESGEVESPRHAGTEFLGLSGPARTHIEAYVARRLKAAEGC